MKKTKNPQHSEYYFQNAVDNLQHEDDLSKDASKWSAMQRYLVWWGKRLWRNSRTENRSEPNALHLMQEAIELYKAIRDYESELVNYDYTSYKERNEHEKIVDKLYNEIGMELADVVQLAYDIAGDFYIDLDKAILEKMRINIEERDWLPPNKDGVIKHVDKIFTK